MQINFGDYRFQTDQQILYKHDELIPLKRNQAALLEFFLADSQSIHSKDAIMDSVWQNKVVSEQVVFQTISQLRNIFGEKAIKTFPKKGYQWQLEINSPPITPQSQSSLATPAPAEPANRQVVDAPPKSIVPKLAAAAFALLLIVILASQLITSQAPVVSLHLLSTSPENIKTVGNQSILKAANHSESFEVQTSPFYMSLQQAFFTPKLAWQKANLAADNWLIWGETFSSKQGAFLHYGLSRNQLDWQGYVYAETEQGLPQAFAKRLEQLQSLGLFAPVLKSLDIGTLNQMIRKAPADPDLLLLLGEHYQGLEHYDVALGYLGKLLKSDADQTGTVYHAQAHWQIGRIYKHRNQHVQSHNSLDDMSKALADSPVWPLYFDYVKTKAWLAYSETDYSTMFNTLEEGLSFFKRQSDKLAQQADPLPLFKLHILYSILAKKAGDDTQKYHHLNQAQALLLKYNLDESNLAVVYYHYALFAQQENLAQQENQQQPENDSVTSQSNSDSSATVYLERILDLPRTVDNFWVQDAAFELLVKEYIQQQDYQAAMALFDQDTQSPRELVLQAQVMLAQDKRQRATELLQTAFEQARIKYDNRAGIDAALILYKLAKDNPKTQAEYWAYLEKNAKPQWIRENVVAGE